jgi:hypothetical protein
MTLEERERWGQMVRAEWVVYCRATGDTKPSHLMPWEGISDWGQEADRRIGTAVALAAVEAERERVRVLIDSAQRVVGRGFTGAQGRIFCVPDHEMNGLRGALDAITASADQAETTTNGGE